MKKTIGMIFLSLCFSLTVVAGLPDYFGKEQILMNDNGIFINCEGKLHEVETITHTGNGFYQADVYGACRRCGSITIEGICQNRNCDGNGPPKN